MTDQERKVMEMVLEALEWHVSRTRPIEKTTEAIEALRQALNVDTINTSKTCVDETEKREHEPAENITETVCSLLRKAHDILSMSSLPPKREWVSLTDEDITEAFVRMRRGLGKYTKFAQIIEAKLKEKNT